MKKIAWIALLLVIALAVTGCSGDKPYAELDIEKYVTLGQYKGLSYTAEDTAVTENQLTLAIQEALSEKGYGEESKEEITSGTVQMGDTCKIDFKGMKDGVAFEGGTAKGYSLTIGSGAFIDGFEDGLVGVTIGSTVELDLTFPENYDSEELAGQDVVFEVTVHSVTARTIYPQLTDAIANQLDKTANTVDEYYVNKRAELEAENVAAAEENKKSDLWTQAVSNMTFANEIPQNLIEDAAKEFTAYYEVIATQSAYDTLGEWLTANGMTQTYFDEQANAYAESVVKSQLAAYAIANAEGFTVSEELFNETAQEYASLSGYTEVEKYLTAVGEDPVRDQAVMDYAVEFVVANAVVQ